MPEIVSRHQPRKGAIVATKSELAFQRILDQKTNETREAVEKCIDEFLSPDPRNRQSASNAACDAVDRLKSMLDMTDQPDWILPLLSNLNLARQHYQNDISAQAMKEVSSIFPLLKHHQWQVGPSEAASGFNFDGVYEKYRDECRIPELFDDMIRCLKEIVTSDQIDSRSALKELNEIIATLQNARNGSYFATRTTWYFVVTWLKNTGWELLGSIPVAGSAVKGLRKTLEQMDAAMNKLHETVQHDLQDKISADFPKLEYQPAKLPAIEQDRDGAGEIIDTEFEVLPIEAKKESA